MLALLADENLHGGIVRGLRRRLASVDLLRAQDVGLSGVKDDGVLAWAAGNGRIVVTHDERTMPPNAYSRVEKRLPMPGVFVVPDSLAIGLAISDLLLLTLASSDAEWEGQVIYLPLR